MFTTCINDTTAARFELRGDCIDDWADKRRKE